MLWIRPAEESDAILLGDLHAASWRSAYRGVLSDEFLAEDIIADRRGLWTSRLSKPTEKQHIFIAGIGHDALGFVCMYGEDDDLWGSFLNNIHVSQSHQRLGIGSKLLNTCACICAERYGNAGLYLWVVQTNEKAQRFYSRYGAENLGESTWNAPGGTVVPLYRFVWKDVQRLRSASC